LHLQINDRDEGGTQSVTWPANNEASSWDAFAYGYVTLIDEPAVAATPAPAEEPQVDETAAGGGDVNVHAEAVPAPAVVAAPAPAPVSAPVTGDAGIIVFVVMMITAAGIVISKKIKV